MLLITRKPHGPAQSSTISNWLKKVLKKSGIKTEMFKAHSFRGASTSKAKVNGASLEDILKRGSWSNQSTWQKFYRKKIVQESMGFQTRY